MSDSLQPHGLQHARPPCPHHLPKFVQFHVHCISDIIQPPHPRTPPSPYAFNLSQHWTLFQRAGCLSQVTKILELRLQHQSFQWIFRVDFPLDWLGWHPCCPRNSQESSPTPHCEGISSLVFCLLYSLVKNLDSVLKSRDTTLPTKARIIKAMVFPVVTYSCESWTVYVYIFICT